MVSRPKRPRPDGVAHCSGCSMTTSRTWNKSRERVGLFCDRAGCRRQAGVQGAYKLKAALPIVLGNLDVPFGCTAQRLHIPAKEPRPLLSAHADGGDGSDDSEDEEQPSRAPSPIIEKDAHIHELEARLDEQGTELEALRAQVQRLTGLLQGAAAVTSETAREAAVDRRPALAANQQHDALASSAAASADSAWKGGLPRGWTTRPSRSRPGEFNWVHEKFGVGLTEPPTFMGPDGRSFHVQVELLEALCDRYYDINEETMPSATLKACFEMCLQLRAGAVDARPAFKAAWKAAKRAMRPVEDLPEAAAVEVEPAAVVVPHAQEDAM